MIRQTPLLIVMDADYDATVHREITRLRRLDNGILPNLCYHYFNRDPGSMYEQRFHTDLPSFTTELLNASFLARECIVPHAVVVLSNLLAKADDVKQGILPEIQGDAWNAMRSSF
jgi:hypothetical protein